MKNISENDYKKLKRLMSEAETATKVVHEDIRNLRDISDQYRGKAKRCLDPKFKADKESDEFRQLENKLKECRKALRDPKNPFLNKFKHFLSEIESLQDLANNLLDSDQKDEKIDEFIIYLSDVTEKIVDSFEQLNTEIKQVSDSAFAALREVNVIQYKKFIGEDDPIGAQISHIAIPMRLLGQGGYFASFFTNLLEVNGASMSDVQEAISQAGNHSEAAQTAAFDLGNQSQNVWRTISKLTPPTAIINPSNRTHYINLLQHLHHAIAEGTLDPLLKNDIRYNNHAIYDLVEFNNRIEKELTELGASFELPKDTEVEKTTTPKPSVISSQSQPVSSRAPSPSVSSSSFVTKVASSSSGSNTLRDFLRFQHYTNKLLDQLDTTAQTRAQKMAPSLQNHPVFKEGIKVLANRSLEEVQYLLGLACTPYKVADMSLKQSINAITLPERDANTVLNMLLRINNTINPLEQPKSATQRADDQKLLESVMLIAVKQEKRQQQQSLASLLS
ncbi:MAG: hypothetical protein K0R63_1807 [Rickettsiales bacterium]|jgi:hypothetical protein|nr:hypothetical protein [Rickettsiales bacterium]